MIVLKNMLKFSLLYIAIVALTIAMLLILAEIGIVSTPLMFVYFIIIVLIMSGFGKYYWWRGFKNIWHIPISQAILYGGFSLFLYIRDLLGFRQSSNFMDFGVEFGIIVIAMLGGIWIIPSIVISIIYSAMAHKL